MGVVTMSSSSMLGTPAVRQIIAKLNKSDKEEQMLIEKIASSCHKFDHKGLGKLTADELFNVVKLQHGIDCSKEEVRKIVSPLSKDKEGRIKIDDFLLQDIHSEDAFKAIDKNKDGFITKGELKLAKKSVGMDQINDVINQYDLNKDGKLSMAEFKQSCSK